MPSLVALLAALVLARNLAMRVLVACEHSGRVREAFRARGHDAWSCDLLWPEDRSQYHYTGSILDHDIVKQDWDLMIAHPDCTFLTVSANRWAGEEWRIEARLSAMHFVRSLWAFPVPRIAIENPIGVLGTFWRQPDQTIQPWQFGHKATKATCLWLKNLPELAPTEVVGPPPKDMTLEEKRIWNEVHRAVPGPDRWRIRSLTYQGIADAMATQWGDSAGGAVRPLVVDDADGVAGLGRLECEVTAPSGDGDGQ